MKTTKEIKKLIRELKDLKAPFDDDADLIAGGLLDSFDVVDLLNRLERSYGVKIDGDQVLPENFRTVRAICDLVNRSL